MKAQILLIRLETTGKTPSHVCFTVSRLVVNGFLYNPYWLASYYLHESHDVYFAVRGDSATMGTDEIGMLNIKVTVQFWVC